MVDIRPLSLCGTSKKIFILPLYLQVEERTPPSLDLQLEDYLLHIPSVTLGEGGGTGGGELEEGRERRREVGEARQL